jgi:hypothetical protein
MHQRMELAAIGIAPVAKLIRNPDRCEGTDKGRDGDEKIAAGASPSIRQ